MTTRNKYKKMNKFLNLRCRICLMESNTTYSLNDSIKMQEETLLIEVLIKNYLPEKKMLSNISNQKICRECMNIIHNYHQLLERFKDTETLLEQKNVADALKNKKMQPISSTNYHIIPTKLDALASCENNQLEKENNENCEIEEDSNSTQISNREDKKHGCKVCGKVYKQSSSLTIHMRVHTGNKPFLCSLCGKTFRQSSDLSYHMRSHNGHKPYMCTICGKAMSMQSHLIEHMRTHNGEKPYKCDECGKGFPSGSNLKRHRIVHTDQRPFKCPICMKTYNRASSLKLHQKLHTDERQFACMICDKRFVQRYRLQCHLRVHAKR